MHLHIWRPLRLPAIMPGLRLHSNSYGCCYGKVLGFKPREYHYQYQVPGIQEAHDFFSGPCSLLGTLNPGWTLRASSTSLLVGVDWMIHSWKSPRNLPMLNAVRPAWKLAKQGRSSKFIVDFWLYILSALHVCRTSRQKEFFVSFIHQSEKKPPLSSFGNDCTTRPGVQWG